MGVRDQLRLRGGTRGEVEEQRIARVRRGVRGVLRRRGAGLLEARPGRAVAADHDAAVVAGERVELAGVRRADDDVADAAALEAVPQVVGGEERGGRDDHRAELHAGEHHLPQRRHVAEHQEHGVAAPDALGTEEVRGLARAPGELGEGQLDLASALVDDPQGGAVVAPRHLVEVVERPVEPVEPRPPEVPARRVVVGSMGEQEVARFEEGTCRARHGHLGREVGTAVRDCMRRKRAGAMPDPADVAGAFCHTVRGTPRQTAARNPRSVSGFRPRTSGLRNPRRTGSC